MEIAAAMVGQKNSAPDDDNQCDFTKIDIRVGKIQKVRFCVRLLLSFLLNKTNFRC